MVEWSLSYLLSPSPQIPYKLYDQRYSGLSDAFLDRIRGFGDVMISLLDDKAIAKVGHQDSSIVYETARRSRVAWFDHRDLNFQELYYVLGEMLRASNAESFNFDLTGIYDQLQYLLYDEENQGHFDWHLDTGRSTRAPRKLAASLILSSPNEYDGGVLQFNEGVTISTEVNKGDIVFFPAYVLHRVTPITRGHRRVVTVWAGGPAFR
jgi:PKHD-type hydroxylase